MAMTNWLAPHVLCFWPRNFAGTARHFALNDRLFSTQNAERRANPSTPTATLRTTARHTDHLQRRLRVAAAPLHQLLSSCRGLVVTILQSVHVFSCVHWQLEHLC